MTHIEAVELRQKVTLFYDPLGRVERTVNPTHRNTGHRAPTSIALPRSAGEQVTLFAQRDDAEQYLVDRVARATAFEILGEKARDLNALGHRILGGLASRRTIAQVLHYYDGAAFVGLPLGNLGEHGALVRTETLVLTSDVLSRDGEASEALGAGRSS